MSENNVFSQLSDDVVLNILHRLEEDPRHWARIACVSTKFSSLIQTVCCRTKCSQTIPAVVSDLLPHSASPSVFSSLYKLSVCCPGLLHAGVLLDNSDFGLERELGPDENFQLSEQAAASSSNENRLFPADDEADQTLKSCTDREAVGVSASDCVWSLYDDLLFDTLYSEAAEPLPEERAESAESHPEVTGMEREKQGFTGCRRRKKAELPESDQPEGTGMERKKRGFADCKRRKICRPLRSHLASGVWNLSREEGNKLLASRFKDDCLYICDWPGCVHVDEKRNYMLFRGVFKNFKQSKVWQNINDWSRSRIDLNCAFCSSKQTWDLLSSFCLRSYFGFHDDGQPQVRAYVCENGHVSGAWTDWPLYT